VEVVELKGEVYYGNIVVEMNGQQVNIDSRPSDALALAVRANVPILVANEVMDEAGIIPEEDMGDQDVADGSEAPTAPAKEAKEPVDEERLSVFEDFLGKLDEEEDDEDDEGDGGKGKGRKKT
jgi:bifunctional DNase/RNase